MTRPADPRPPGRPRDTRAGAAIIDATHSLLADGGYDALSVEAVAELAGVAKTTVYRRWPSKEQLVLGAVEVLYEQLRIADTGDLRADLVALLADGHRLFVTSRAGQIMPQIVGEVHRGTPLGRALRDEILGPQVQALTTRLASARDRGKLREDVDLDVAVAALVGPMMFAGITGVPRGADADFPERVLDQALTGLLA